MHARVAWAIVGLTVVAAIADTAFTAAYRSLLSESTWADHGWPLGQLASVGCALMGAFIISRYPRQIVGWLLCVASLLSVTLAAEAYSLWVLNGHGPGSPYWAHLAAWAGPLLGWPAFTALVIIFLISPNGHVLSPQWRWVVWVTLGGLVLHTVGTLTISPATFVYGQRGGTRAISAPLFTVGYLLIAAGLIASAVSLVLRLRRSRDDERRQLLWIASSAAFLAFGVVFILVVPRIQGVEGTWLAGIPLRLAQVAVPLCVAVAVLRHRLLEIEVIVNRALVLALATALVATGYVLVVVAVGLAVGGGTGRFWPSLLATAIVAMAFQPLRRHVVKIANRLAFGTAAVPYEALADFSRRLGDSPDPSALLPATAEAAARAVNAARTVVVLHVDAGPDRSAVWPPFATDDSFPGGVETPIGDHGERLGSITVVMPPGHALRAPEQRLLIGLADQAGMAFRNARLTAELVAQVEELARRTLELSDSRRRLISAGDAERSRLELAITRQVVVHLAPLPNQLHQLSQLHPQATAGLDAATLVTLTEGVNVALESLREITRGVFPAQLARSGLPAALASLLARTETPGRLVVDAAATGRRFDPRAEAAAYFCVVETTRDFEDPVMVVLTTLDDELHVVVSGRAPGGRPPMGHIRDRIEAAGGSVSITEHDSHTVVDARLPAHEPVAAS